MFQYNTIEEALEDLRQGRMILCTDDPDRENEGDLICAAEFATTENVNFMATHAKGPLPNRALTTCLLPNLGNLLGSGIGPSHSSFSTWGWIDLPRCPRPGCEPNGLSLHCFNSF